MTPLLLAAVLSGIVVDASGASIAGAQVTAAEQRTTQTNERGEFRFENLPAGSYRLEIRMQGFFLERLPEVTLAAADDARLPTVTLHVGIPLPPGCDYSLQPPAFKRAPAPRASFRGWTATRGETVTLGDRTVQARRDGFFEFPDLAPGTYTFRAGSGFTIRKLRIRAGEAVELDGWITPESTDRILREPKRRQPVICL